MTEGLANASLIQKLRCGALHLMNEAPSPEAVAGGPAKTVALSGVLVALLATAIFINYLDRGNLATAGPLIKDELKLTNTQFGVLTSAFFWIYVPGQVAAAWMVHRINAYRTLALGLAVWSAATVLSGFATGFATLLGLRILLGVGESAGFPASSKLLARHLPARQLGSANALISTGIMMGPAVGTLLGGLVVARLGWRPLFLVFGGVSLMWLIPWLATTRDLSASATAAGGDQEPRFLELLSKRQMWGAMIGHFASNYPFYLVVSWLPIYLVKSQGYSLTQMAEVSGLVYVAGATSALAFGWLADQLMRRGASSTQVRLPMIIAALLLSAAGLLACGLGGRAFAIAGLVCISIANGPSSFNAFAIGQTLGGAKAAGKWIGVQNCFGNLSGIVGPIITGAVVDRTGQFSLAFLIAAAIALIGALAWGLIVRRIEPIAFAD